MRPELETGRAALVKAASPAMARLDAAIGSMRHFLVLADRDGVLCEVRADPQTRAMAWAINLRRGASWHERHMGCNALGTALATRQPLIVAGREHFMPAYVAWTSVGIPVRGSEGDITGALQLSLPFGKADPQAWHWTLAAVRWIEARLGAREAPPEEVEASPTLPDAPQPLQIVREVLELLAEQVELPPPYKRFLGEARSQLDVAEFEWLATAGETSAALAGQGAALEVARAEAQEGVRRLALAAHDLKGPLGVIVGYVQLMLQDLRAGEQIPLPSLLQHLDLINQTAYQLRQIIDILLEGASLESGVPPSVQARAMDLHAAARAAAGKLQALAGNRRIVVDADTPSIVAEWDAQLLQRVLDNLLGNAIKFSPDGSEIRLTLTREEGDGGTWAILKVRDQGLGIPAADLERIFEPFVRGANVVGQVNGTGLGLAGARRIVEQHGGSLTAESQEGHGATFTMRLPMATAGRTNSANHRSAR